MIYQYTLAPIESILETVFVILVGVSNSYILSLVLLAILVRFATKPLEKYANRAVTAQAEIESVLAPQIDVIKLKHIAVQRHEAIKHLYARYAYSPVYTIRSLAGLGVQLPFFIAAYFMLSGSAPLSGIVIPFLGDLGQPDTLLFGKFHLMPFVMTLVNVLALATVPEFSRKTLIQGLFISLMFLVLLYESPLALLVYWTTSNLFSLISNFTPAIAISKKLNLRKTKGKFKNTFVGRKFEEYAYIFFVTNLAILVPILGVLGDQFNFFTAHNLSSNSIIILLLTTSLIPPLVLIFLRWISKQVGVVKLFDVAVLFAFLGLFLFYSLNKVGYGVFPAKYEPYILFTLALVSTTAAVLIICKNRLLRTLSYLSLIIPLLILDFIFVSPAATLFKNFEKSPSSQMLGMNDTPVFLLIFDELSGLTLQNAKGELDVSRYPGFAELAAQADYFPNALAAAYHTTIAIPSIASGNLQARGKTSIGLAPGKNLIELFQSTSTVYAQSTVLPADLMAERNTNTVSFISDFLTLYAHILSHKDWIEDKIGVIPQAWKGFGIFFNSDKPQLDKQALNPNLTQFLDWLEQVNNSGVTSQFNFIHTQFPHAHYTTTSLGRPVLNNKNILISTKEAEDFVVSQPLLNVVAHNYMQQSAYTDHLVLEFIQALKSKKLFDKSLIIVTSDHGVSYNRKGINRRFPVNEYSWKNIISVPLFIKYPNQKVGDFNSSFVTTLDISSTIMNVVGIDSPWESVGQNLKEMKEGFQARSVELIPDYEKYFKNISALFQSARNRKEALFSEGTPVHTVAVNYTENPVYTDLLKTKLPEATTGVSSNLYAVWDSDLKPEEVSQWGAIYHGGKPVNNKIIAAVVDGRIQAVFKSGKIKKQDGFFAFSLPENRIIPVEFNVFLYEIEGESPFIFRKIQVESRQKALKKALKYEFSQRQKKFHYDLKGSVLRSNGIDELNVGDGGIQILSSKSNDPYTIFKSISQNTISEPIFRIRLESDRELPINLYYQTIHKPKFHYSQRLDYNINKGSNTIYIKVPDKDFSGPFRIDTGEGGPTEVLIQDIEVRQ